MRKIIYNSDKINLDDGVFFGKGVFETIYVDKNMVLLNEHLERLKSAMNKMMMEPLEEETLKKFLKNQNFYKGSLKILVTDKNIVVTQRKSPYNEESYKKGFSLTYSSVLRNSTSFLTSIKSTEYIENIFEKRKAMEKGYNDVIFMNEKNFVSETSCANIFIVKNKKIYTPKCSDGLLSGIIRNWIIKNYDVEEKSITKEELQNADEVFLTNSLMGIMSVHTIYDKENQINININETYFAQNIRENYQKLL